MFDAAVLEGTFVRLEPLKLDDRQAMKALFAVDLDNWTLQTRSALGNHFESYWAWMIDTPRRITLAAFDAQSGRLAGTSSFLEIDAEHRSLEIGATWFHPPVSRNHDQSRSEAADAWAGV